MIKLKQILTEQDISGLFPLARTIWREVFPPIIGSAQTEYMLKTYQSEENIRHEIEEGAQYFFIENEDSRPVGYLAYELHDDCLFISKLYLVQSERGKGLTSEIFNLFENKARENDKAFLRLRVNRGNSQAINVYLHKGFTLFCSK